MAEKKRDIEHAAEEIEQLFADLWQVFPFSGLRRGFRPQVDCLRSDDPPTVTVVVEVAGIDPEHVHVIAHGRELVIAGERVRPRATGAVYQQMEIDYGAFERHVTLPDDVDTAAAEASYDRGLLTITLPIATTPAREVKVPIEVRRQP
jgi:HSP20 family protein